MARTARAISQHGIYHVILRGVNRQQIFFDHEDCRHFLSLLARYKNECGYRLLAYCLMGNHVHLLIQEGEVSVSSIFRHIETAFVYWYNGKYERNGHLFQGRFTSEPVNDERYLLTVFRYILNNPVKAGFCAKAEDFRYSSAGEYFLGKKGISDLTLIRSMHSDQVLKEFMVQPNNDQCLEMDDSAKSRCSDEKAKQLILREFGTMTPLAGKPKGRASLNRSINKLMDAGISIRQLNRLTGITKKIIENAGKE